TMMFRRASDEISFHKIFNKSVPRLDITLTKNHLPTAFRKVKQAMGNEVDKLSKLLDGAAMVIVLDEAHFMGPPPGKLRICNDIQHLISQTPKVYQVSAYQIVFLFSLSIIIFYRLYIIFFQARLYANDVETPTAKHFVSVALHMVLQEVIPMGLN